MTRDSLPRWTAFPDKTSLARASRRTLTRRNAHGTHPRRELASQNRVARETNQWVARRVRVVRPTPRGPLLGSFSFIRGASSHFRFRAHIYFMYIYINIFVRIREESCCLHKSEPHMCCAVCRCRIDLGMHDLLSGHPRDAWCYIFMRCLRIRLIMSISDCFVDSDVLILNLGWNFGLSVNYIHFLRMPCLIFIECVQLCVSLVEIGRDVFSFKIVGFRSFIVARYSCLIRKKCSNIEWILTRTRFAVDACISSLSNRYLLCELFEDFDILTFMTIGVV